MTAFAASSPASSITSVRATVTCISTRSVSAGRSGRCPGQAGRRTHKGREVVKPLWSRIAPALQLPAVFNSAVGRELRRTAHGGIRIRCGVAGLPPLWRTPLIG